MMTINANSENFNSNIPEVSFSNKSNNQARQLITKLVNVRTAAEILGVGKSTVYRLMENGDLPYVRITKSARRIPSEALHEYIARNLVQR